MDNRAEPFLVARSCTEITSKQQLPVVGPLHAFRDHAAYVLLGEPGAGKTTAFRQEADSVGGEYITARDFCAIGPAADGQDQILFIDGLDEMRAGASDGNTPLDQVRHRLKTLKRPRFRLACREADWLGASDTQALIQVSPDQKILVLHLNPLTTEDVIAILQHNAPEVNATELVEKAQKHGLEALLDNPQTLHLLVKAVAGNGQQWPQSRSQVYEMACRQLILELNKAHRNAKSANIISDETLLEGAGYLCAVQLLSGMSGFALDDNAASAQYVRLSELVNPDKLPLRAALKTQLFQGTGDGAERRIPIHRSVAEYLGARYIAQSIHTRALPIGRVIALMSGEDGGVVPDLRGLMAWLALHCQTARAQLIDCDALGVVLYGDVKGFSPEDKIRILNGLKDEAQSNPWFHSGENAHRFGALASSDMEPAFRKILESPSRAAADQALLACMLDAITFGKPMSTLEEQLDQIIRDASYWNGISEKAAKARMQISPDANTFWMKILADIQSGGIKDSDDELLGTALKFLYPAVIPPSEILNYLITPKKEAFLGAYFMFWRRELLNTTNPNDLPVFLEILLEAQRSDTYKQNSFFFETVNSLAGRLLEKCITVHGDVSSDARIYSWIGINPGDNWDTQIKVQDTIKQWFADRPERFKSIWAYGVGLCHSQEKIDRCLNECTQRLYKFAPPIDMVNWCLESAVTKPEVVARYYFERAVLCLKQQSKLDYLTSENLELLNEWVQYYPHFQQWLAPFISCTLDDWRREDYIDRQQRAGAEDDNRHKWIHHIRSNLATIHSGRASPGIFHQLAMIYKGLTTENYGSNPHERLIKYLNGDESMAVAVKHGLQQLPTREDLPDSKQIIALAVQGQTYRIGIACIAGMDELYQIAPEKAMQLDDITLARLLAFHLADNSGEDLAWVMALLKDRPALVAMVLTPYWFSMMKAKKSHLQLIHTIANDDAYKNLAQIVLPVILAGFPARALKDQITYMLVPLLRSALHYLNSQSLIELIEKKLTPKSMEVGQRVYWLTCGLVIQPVLYKGRLVTAIGKNQVHAHNLVHFFYPQRTLRNLDSSSLPLSTVALLVELLASVNSPTYPMGIYINNLGFETTDLVHTFINTLGAAPSESATQALEHLLSLPKLASWHTTLRASLHAQRITRRKASFKPVTSVEVSRMLANLQPANAADLAALVSDHLRDIARKIRDGNTNDYQQYWSLDSKNKNHVLPKPENDCRNALLSDLEARLAKLGIDAQPEGSYADNKRADIRVSFNSAERSLNVPIEIKKDSHSDLWSAIHKQLIPRYVRDPGTEGQGIYLVFWFGGKGMPLPADAKRPKSAKELEDRLLGLLTTEERHHIHICVIDCALHPPGNGK